MIGQQCVQIVEFLNQAGLFFTGKLDEQDRRRFANECFLNHGSERRVLKRKLNHRAVNEFDCRWIEFDDVLCRVHCLIKALEVHNPQGFMNRQGTELERNLPAVRECSLRADQNMCKVSHTVVGVRTWVLTIK